MGRVIADNSNSLTLTRVRRTRTNTLKSKRIVYSTTFGAIPAKLRMVFQPINHLVN